MSETTRGRYARENFTRAGHDRELAAFWDVLHSVEDIVPVMTIELAELGRLITKYPLHAQRFVARLPARTAASP